jgi:two-component system chemotaxis response regulator CheV
MVDFKSIDEKTNLAGTNRMEILMFMLQDQNKVPDAPLFGINVFKVRELMVVPQLLEGPNKREAIAGMANIRGKAVPVIDLNSYFGTSSDCDGNILVVSEFNGSTQGFLVHEVHDITQLEWIDMQEPPELVTELAGQKRGNVLTAMSKLEDGRMLLIIDVEQVISEVLGSSYESIEATEMPTDHQGNTVFFVDDSKVARMQIGKILEKMGLQCESANNGDEAWQRLSVLADEAEESGVKLCKTLNAVVTDVEMPVMDGYVLTGKIKADKRFDNVPVLMHSSLSASENERLGMKVGADAYVPKLRPKEFSQTLNGLLKTNKAANQ